MTSNKTIAALAAALTLWLATPPADAQHVLVCFTLHNDLANFDRRARSVERYSKSTVAAALAAAKREAGYEAIPCPPSDDSMSRKASCEGISEQANLRESEPYRLRWLRLDPVRRQIIKEMIRNGCPLDAVATN